MFVIPAPGVSRVDRCPDRTDPGRPAVSTSSGELRPGSINTESVACDTETDKTQRPGPPASASCHANPGDDPRTPACLPAFGGRPFLGLGLLPLGRPSLPLGLGLPPRARPRLPACLRRPAPPRAWVIAPGPPLAAARARVTAPGPPLAAARARATAPRTPRRRSGSGGSVRQQRASDAVGAAWPTATRGQRCCSYNVR